MRSRIVWAVVVVLLLLGQPSAMATHDSDVMTRHQVSNDLGTMAYDVYKPAGLTGAAPLFLHIHGGNNKTTDAAHRSRLNTLARERGFVVAYPQEDPNNGQAGIWNGGAAVRNGRQYRATSLIAQLTREVISSYRINPDRVIVGGISAGAAMAVAMAVQYPELYDALHIEVGSKYGDGTAAEAGRRAYEVMGARARRIPLMLSWGSADPIAMNADEESLLDHWLILHDWIDDGAANGSVSLTPAATREGVDGKPYAVETFVDAAGCVLAERWVIQGMFHAYAGGDQTAPYDVVSDPNAPNMRAVAYDFFMRQFDGRADGRGPRADCAFA